ncbi:hypothetical protein BX600DRAFT_473984 [Xylariales sp. PMI_506]|nr:hypothetical protein BX600DRAFT_473984 [Xylariales sp. PMI_506]
MDIIQSIRLPLQESLQKPQPKPKAKKKRDRRDRFKDAPPSVLARRREQNRISQRAYRDRKEQHIKELEALLNESEAKLEALSRSFAELLRNYIQMKTANDSMAVSNNMNFM